MAWATGWFRPKMVNVWLIDCFRIAVQDGMPKPSRMTLEIVDRALMGWLNRVSLAHNWRRRGLFEEVTFIFPNAPMIPITVVRLTQAFSRLKDLDLRLKTLLTRNFSDRTLECQCLVGTTSPSLVVM